MRRYLTIVLAAVILLTMTNVGTRPASAGELPNTYDISTGDIAITEGVDGNLQVTYPDGVDDIEAGNEITIVGGTIAEPAAHKITVEGNVTANITLQDVHIQGTTDNAFSIENAASVDLTLTGDNSLNGASGMAGLHVPGGTSLTINASSDGSLAAESASNGAGIGGNDGEDAGTITIDGGTVMATSSSRGASIGGGYHGAGGTITINGGSVTATSSYSGAGIGGGSTGTGGAITINGGSVMATGGSSGAAIGGGYQGAGGTIAINNGTVTAVSAGSSGPAAIGGGYQGAGGTITINNGSVTATNNSYGAAIGGGIQGAGGTITVNGGSVTATGGKDGAGIGGAAATSGTITITGGIIEATGGPDSAGIGSGGWADETVTTGSIQITGGTVIAKGQDSGAGIGGSGANANGGDIIISGADTHVTAIGGYWNSGDDTIVQYGAGIGSGVTISSPESTTQSFEGTPGTLRISGGASVIAYGYKDAIGVNDLEENSTEAVLMGSFNEPAQAPVRLVGQDGKTAATFNMPILQSQAVNSFSFAATVAPGTYKIVQGNVVYGGQDSNNQFLAVANTITKFADLALTNEVDTRYTVTFNSNDGSSVDSIGDVLDGSTISAPQAPVRAGYTFAGWYKDELFDHPWNFGQDTVADNMTLFAKWVPVVTTTTPTPPSTPATEEIAIDVTGTNDAAISKTKITRTYESDGTAKDEVVLTSDNVQEALDHLKDNSGHTLSVVIPDNKDVVSQVDVKVPVAAVNQLTNGATDLRIDTENVQIAIPSQSLSDFNDDLYFNLVPVKNENERTNVENRAKTESIVLNAANDQEVKVLGRPMTIETNLQSRQVTLTLPLKDISLPSDPAARQNILDNLAVFIEHSDGTKELVQGEVVSYQDGTPGIQFNVNKFSTFSVLYSEGFKANEDSIHQPYIKGFGDGTFGPDRIVTRAQMASMLANLLGTEYDGNGLPSFSDLSSKHWAFNAIEIVNKTGLMKGYTDSRFGPEDGITRAEMATIAYNWLELNKADAASSTSAGTAATSQNYSDLSSKHWAYTAIMEVQANGIMSGYTDHSFKPDQKLTRTEAVKTLNRLFNRGPLYGVEEPSFSDVPVTHWAYHEVEEAALQHQWELDQTGKETIK